MDECLREALPRHRLHQVVDGAELERVDRSVGMRRDEHDGGTLFEPAEDARQLETVELGHAHVDEDRVVRPRAELAEGRRAARRHVDLADARQAAQQARKIGERGLLVVDGEDAEALAHAARTPARNFGTVIRTTVPWPGVDSISSP